METSGCVLFQTMCAHVSFLCEYLFVLQFIELILFEEYVSSVDDFLGTCPVMFVTLSHQGVMLDQK